MTQAFRARAWCAPPIIALALLAAATARAQPAPADPTDAGKRVYQRANCVGCHKWHGDGGGGYGGDALSLRKTMLPRELIILTVTCGRPGTGMPFFERGAYDAVACYGKHRADLGAGMPPEANVFLRPPEIEAVTDYVLAHVKGKGEPNLAECQAFFGTESRACNIYKDAASGATLPAPATSAAPKDAK